MNKKIRLENLRHARRLTAKIINDLLTNNISESTARAVFSGLQVFKSIFETEQIESRIELLEKQLGDQHGTIE